MAKLATNQDGFKLVLQKITKAELARCLGLPAQSITQWKDQVPPARVMAVSIITGIPCETILPDDARHWHAVAAVARKRP